MGEAMRRLVLMRHAKSSWDDPDMDDRDRPLSPRGRLAAVLMGAWLAEVGLVPDAALISDSRRTVETWERLRHGGGFEAPVEARAALYMADPDAQLAALRSAPEGARVLLMLGHEPGTGAFLRRLADGTEGAGCRRAYEKFPTGSIAVLEFDGAWAEAAYRAARFVRFTTPKDLV